jgi:hypothetical protein
MANELQKSRKWKKPLASRLSPSSPIHIVLRLPAHGTDCPPSAPARSCLAASERTHHTKLDFRAY